jgi:tetratricopeptide (TPR) repeat protein
LFVLLSGALALKILVLVQLKDHPLTQPDAGLDTTAYATLANRVLGGDVGLGPGLYYVSPLYIYFVAGCLALFKSYTALRLVQIMLGTASVGFIFLMTRAWFGMRAAWTASGLAAFTGLFTFYEVLILQSSIDAFLTSAALYALTIAQPLAAGVIFGIQTLNRPNMPIAAIGVALVTVAVLRRVRPAALIVAGLALGMAPVMIRNLIVAHQFSFVSSHGGLNFYIGNNEQATGFYFPVEGISPTIEGQERDVRRVAERALGHPVTDAEASDYFFALGRAWILEHPGDAVALFLKKFAFVFIAAHVPLPHSYPFYAYDAGTALRLLPVGPWLLIPLGFVGLVFAAPSIRRREFIGWASFVPAYAAAVGLFFVADRYRLPVLVPLSVGAGASIDWIARTLAAGRIRTLAVPATVFIVLLAAVNWPHHLDEGRWLEGLRLAQQLVIHQRYDEADQWAARLDASGPPQPGAGHYGVAAQLLLVHQPARALAHLQTAHDINPSDARTDYALGQALLDTGQPQSAIPHLRHGFDAGIDLPEGGYYYARALEEAGEFAAAAQALQRINPGDKATAETWLRLGRIGMEAHAPEAAERFFRHAVEMRPDLASAHQQYGLNLVILGRFDDAARELSEAVRLDPRDPDSLSHLAYSEAKLGRMADARAHVEAALAIDPSNQLARQLMALLRSPELR